MANVSQLTEQIALKQTQKANLLAQAQQLDQSAAAWKADADNDKIRIAHKKADEAERTRKYAEADSRRKQAAEKRQEAMRIDNDIAALNAQIVALGEAEKELAKQGKTSTAVETVALGQAQATVRDAEINAQATASAIQAETDKKKIILYVGIGVFVVAVIIIAAVVVPKLKKKKNAKK